MSGSVLSNMYVVCKIARFLSKFSIPSQFSYLVKIKPELNLELIKPEPTLMSGGVLSNMYVVCKIALFLGHPVPKSHLYDDKIWRHYAGASRSLCSLRKKKKESESISGFFFFYFTTSVYLWQTVMLELLLW